MIEIRLITQFSRREDEIRTQSSVLDKASLARINIIGTIVAGGLSLFLIALWRMGPINPG